MKHVSFYSDKLGDIHLGV